ncbi:hypothetical protein KFD70_20250 [Bacillus pfraonensis]|uniref:hypothetical protein n=1 Tax=Bacillus TaxID=1386 RepID=UPI0030130006
MKKRYLENKWRFFIGFKKSCSVQIAMKHTVTTLYKDKKISQELAEEIEKRVNDLVEKQEKQVEVAYSQLQEKVRKRYEEMSRAEQLKVSN